jgi:hypothetical protein
MAPRGPSWFLGRKISRVSFIRDGINIGFDDEASLAICNPCSLIDNFHPSRYIGAKVTVESWGRDQFSVDLDNSSRITVDLRDEVWTGPEAMVFYYENNGTMVVNEPPEETMIFREETDK